MEVYEYSSYEDYVAEQTAANKRKLDMVWVSEGNVRMICAHFGSLAKSVLCHGTRNAAEQKLFKDAWPDAEIIGTEISDTASQFPMTMQHDMHDPKDEWFGQFDIVYSNSFDHTVVPIRAMMTWVNQLAEGGRLYVDFADDPKVNYSSKSDPLSLEPGDMEKIIRRGGGRLIAKLDGKSAKGHRTTIYVIGKRLDDTAARS